MHPDSVQLAAYLDGALDQQARAELRAHILTCAICSARVEQLRADARRISRTLASASAPDVRAAVRSRLKRSRSRPWIARGGGFAGALTALAMLILLVTAGREGTAGGVPDRLFVVDREAGQLVALDANNGARLAAVEVGEQPSKVRYDQRRDLLYVLFARGVVAIAPEPLAIVERWQAPAPFDGDAGIALDERRGQLYVAQPNSGAIMVIDVTTFTADVVSTVEPGIRALALSPDGRTLFTFNTVQARLQKIDLDTLGPPQELHRPNQGRWGWLALSPDGQTAYMLRTDERPLLQRIDTRNGDAIATAYLESGPGPQDLILLDAGHLAIARGDTKHGGVEIISTDSLSVTTRLDPLYDEHKLAVGPAGSLFALNTLHDTVTRYNLDAPAVAWRTPPGSVDARDAVFVPGGWRWPW